MTGNGIWSEGSGDLALVAQAGDQAVGAPEGVRFGGAFSFPVFLPRISSGGQSAFIGYLHGAGVNSANDSGVWIENAGSLRVVAREGEAATEGLRFGSPEFFVFNDLLVNNSGDVSFIADLTDSDANATIRESVWTARSGSLALIARDGARAPGTSKLFGNRPGGGNVTFSRISLNAAGETAFIGRLTGNGDGSGIWIADSASTQLIAQEGAPAPGAPAGVKFGPFAELSLNDGGQVAFIALLSGGVAATNDSGIWTSRQGSSSLVVRERDAAPAFTEGVNFAGFSSLALNSRGEVAFTGLLRGGGVNSTSDSGLWKASGGVLALIAQEGHIAPDTGGSAHFTAFGFTSEIVLNSIGRLAFLATLGGNGVNSFNNRGIWAEDMSGQLRLIVREGDVLQVGPGDFRTVSGLNFQGNGGIGDSRPIGFNDRGQVAFFAGFTDGSSGFFVSDSVAVPESPTAVLAALMCLAPSAVGRRWGSVSCRNVS
nr:choice-of-anchor tandem repeat NxxGxxAF-containing protein [Lacipirellula limnantheis]